MTQTLQIKQVQSDYTLGNVIVPALKFRNDNEVNFATIGTKTDTEDYFTITLTPTNVSSQTNQTLSLCHYDEGDTVED